MTPGPALRHPLAKLLRVACLLLGLPVGAGAWLLLTVQAAIAVPIPPGNLLVADGAGLILVDPKTGSQTLVSPGSAGDVKIATNGDIFISTGGAIFSGDLLRVDPATGLRTLIASGGFRKFDILPSGDILAATDSGLVRVNPVTGVQSVFLSLPVAGIPESGAPNDVGINSDGNIWFITPSCCLFRFDPVTGMVHGPLFGIDAHPFGLDIGPLDEVLVAGASLNGIFPFNFPPTAHEYQDVVEGPDRTLYAAGNPGLDGGPPRIATVTHSGVETIITSNGLLVFPSGLDFVTFVPVPGPASLVLIALGFGLLVVRVASRRSGRGEIE